MTEAPAILVTDLAFAYENGTHALDGLQWRVETGQFVALLAASGAGKTTLLKVLIGLLKPQRGSVRIFGHETSRLSPGDLYRQVGLVFQSPSDQLFGATVDEDIAFGPRNLDLPPSEVERRVDHALQSVDIAHLRGRAIHQLSYGEQKRVAIAGVLAMEPRVLLLDEPMAGLDPWGERNMMEVLHRLNRAQGITVIIATHSVDLLPLFADRLCLLHDGAVLREGPVEDVFSNRATLETAKLRLPYVATLFDELRGHGVPLNRIPLTVKEARTLLLDMIPRRAT